MRKCPASCSGRKMRAGLAGRAAAAPGTAGGSVGGSASSTVTERVVCSGDGDVSTDGACARSLGRGADLVDVPISTAGAGAGSDVSPAGAPAGMAAEPVAGPAACTDRGGAAAVRGSGRDSGRATCMLGAGTTGVSSTGDGGDATGSPAGAPAAVALGGAAAAAGAAGAGAGAGAAAGAGAGVGAGAGAGVASAGLAAPGPACAGATAWAGLTTGTELAAGGTAAGGAGAGAVGGAEGARGGSRVSGSTYPCSSDVRRMPSWTYGTLAPGSPLEPIVPTPSPSATVAPSFTATEPRCVSVTDHPSEVSIVTDLPLPGTVPAKLTSPAAGAWTADPGSPPRSTPRCCPASYGCSGSNENGRRTGPSAGHVHAQAAGAAASATASTSSSRRMARNLGSGVVGVRTSVRPD
jgi:hypothetical protein